MTKNIKEIKRKNLISRISFGTGIFMILAGSVGASITDYKANKEGHDLYSIYQPVKKMEYNQWIKEVEKKDYIEEKRNYVALLCLGTLAIMLSGRKPICPY